ncbi:MAG: S41 family peptidase [Anaerolineae bacterium]|nr:S41 family peptidase [Gemmatimonadaceae bacterium]
MSGALITGGWFLQRGLEGGGGMFDRAKLFNQVVSRVANNYVDTLSHARLYRMAADGMLDNLHDPYSAFLPPERFARLNESTTGNYGGIGIQIDVREDWITIIAPMEGTPAARAGIQTGDRIVAVDGRPAKGLAPEEALKTLRGPSGTRIKLLIERPGVTERMTFDLKRAEIHAPAVRQSTMLNGQVGYVDVDIFSETTAHELREAVSRLRRRGMKTLVLDLRGNPGGLLDQGVDVSDLFLNRGQKIVTMRGRASLGMREFVDDGQQPWPDLPVIVLTDGGSASASEIVAGALQDHDRAVVIGASTFGKGSAQSVFRVGGDAALKLTTARWYTPSGRSIQKPFAPESDAEDDEADTEDLPGEPPLDERERFKTDAGRTVFGGGGITPDLLARAAEADSVALRLQQALGSDLPKFRDALTEYALGFRAGRLVASPDFEVTSKMLDELWRRMILRGVTLPRTAFDEGSPIVSRLLGFEIARYVFGQEAEFLRRVRYDRAISAALELTSGATTQQDLLEAAAKRRLSKQEDIAPPR